MFTESFVFSSISLEIMAIMLSEFIIYGYFNMIWSITRAFNFSFNDLTLRIEFNYIKRAI